MPIVNNDELKVVITSYGLNRVAQCLSTPSENITISKMKFGLGKYNQLIADYDYYDPQATQTDLEGPISGADFPIIDKQLLEDEVTISFHSIIPENFSGYDIREVGLYETINGIDYLFAVGAYQPIVKPSSDYNYFITVDFYLFLKSFNLADIYDQIILDSSTQLVSDVDFENLMRTILFVEGNLETQIEGNSVELGYNRASQLHDKIVANEKDYSYFTIYSNYSDLLNYVGSDNIFSYWVFNYPRRNTATNSIIDISTNGYNLSTDKPVNQYDRSYEGIAAVLDFTGTSSFNLPPDVELSLLNADKSEDISFSMMFIVNPNDHNTDLTLLAKSNYSVGTNVFEITEKTDRSLEVKLFSDSNNYLTFSSNTKVIPNESHAIILSYNKDKKEIDAYLNGSKLDISKSMTGTYTHMNASDSTLYAYTATPQEIIYADNAAVPTALYNIDGTPYTGTIWSINSTDNKVYYGNIQATQNGSSSFNLYPWSCTVGGITHTIYTKEGSVSSDTVLYNANFTEYTGTEFQVVQSGSSYVIQYNTNETTLGTVVSYTRYKFIYTNNQEVIWANKVYSTGVVPTQLFNANGTIYQGTDWVIGPTAITYKTDYTATYDSTKNITVPTVGLTSYVVASDGSIIKNINSKINIISIVKAELTETEVRAISLTLVSTLGKNPCMTIGA